jgi:hypothetical protein
MGWRAFGVAGCEPCLVRRLAPAQGVQTHTSRRAACPLTLRDDGGQQDAEQRGDLPGARDARLPSSSPAPSRPWTGPTAREVAIGTGSTTPAFLATFSELSSRDARATLARTMFVINPLKKAGQLPGHTNAHLDRNHRACRCTVFRTHEG